MGLKPNDKINGIAFTQWDGTLYWDKVGVNTKIDPRQDPDFSLKKWITIARNDKSLPANIQTLAKKKENDLSETEKKSLSQLDDFDFLKNRISNIEENPYYALAEQVRSQPEVSPYDIANNIRIKTLVDHIGVEENKISSLMVF